MLMLLRQRRGLLYLLRATFGQDIAAPLPSPSPEGLTYVQIDGQFSQSGGKLNFPAQSTPFYGDQAIYSSSLTRITGRAMLVEVTQNATTKFSMAGWDADTVDKLRHGLYFYAGAALYAQLNSVELPIGTYAAATAYQVAVILRSSGAFFCIKGGTYTNWTLVWVDNAVSVTPMYAGFTNLDAAGTLDDFRVLDLPAFATDALVYTNRLVAAAAGATTTSTADAWIEWTWLLTTGLDMRVQTHYTDVNNGWLAYCNNTDVQLYERSAGVQTLRANVAHGVSVGATARTVVVQQGAVIKVYVNNVLKITYSSASFNMSVTGIKVDTVSGGISELIAWPLYPQGLPA